MTGKLGLKGTGLLVFAVIYGFDAAGNYFTGGEKYLSKVINASEKSVRRALKKLLENGFIRVSSLEDVNLGKAVYSIKPGVGVFSPA